MSQIVSKRINRLRATFTKILQSARHISERQYRFYFQVVLFSATATTTGAYMAYNTVFLDKYRSFLQMYSAAQEAPLNEKLELLALRVWNEAHVARRHKLLNLVQFFPCVGCEPFSAGSLESRFGAIIGLPHNFTYETIDDVKTSDVQFFGQHDPYMKWRSEAGKQLIESLVLSEKAKKFAIAREIHLTNTFRLHLNTLNILASTFISIALGQEAINRFKIPRNFNYRFIIRLFSLAVGFSIWSLANEILNYNWNASADEAAVNQGEEYFEGAIEYYDKMRKRNAALYELLGERGKSMFTKEGDVKRLFGKTTIPTIKQLEHSDNLKTKSQEPSA